MCARIFLHFSALSVSVGVLSSALSSSQNWVIVGIHLPEEDGASASKQMPKKEENILMGKEGGNEICTVGKVYNIF